MFAKKTVLINKNVANKRVVGTVGGLFCLNRTGSEFSGLYGLNHSDSAAHAKHYVKLNFPV